MIRIAIADDQLLFRRGMVSIINQFPDIEVVLEADNGQVLLDALAIADPKPDVVLLDLSMPVLNGVETTKLIHQHHPGLRIIILSVYGEDRFVSHLIDLGVNGYLFKNVEPKEVEQAIRTVMEQDFYFNQAFLNAMRSRINKKTRLLLTDDIPSLLTVREKEVLQLICKQLTAQEIDDTLCLSTRTVEGHRNNLLEKTGAKNTAGLVLFAIKHWLVDPNHLI